MNKKILLVEDCEDNRLLLARQLTAHGYEIIEARDGSEVFQIMDSEIFDIVLLDIMLPDISGIEILKWLRLKFKPSELPVIMVSSLNESKEIADALNHGANDYVVKPVDQTVVRARINSQLLLKKTQMALKESEERYALSIQGANDGIWDWDLKSDYIYFSDRCANLLGYENIDELGSNSQVWQNITYPVDTQKLQENIDLHISGKTEKLSVECRLIKNDNEYSWFLIRGVALRDSTGPYRMAGSITDISQNKLYDSLTGLANRELFKIRLETMFKRAIVDSRNKFAVIILNIDRFKRITAGYGHDTGDDLLSFIARTLKRVSPGASTVARFGSDEFAILMSITAKNDALLLIDKIIFTLNKPISINSHSFSIRATIGVAFYNDYYTNSLEILRDAGTAQNHSRLKDKNNYVVFDSAMHSNALHMLWIENSLVSAMDNNEISLFYQPIVSIPDNRIVSFEALIRWRHPDKGFISPLEFIPIAEESGLIKELGKRMLELASQNLKTWHKMGFTSLKVAVNFSAVQFEENLAEIIKKIMEQNAINPEALIVEITETLLMSNFNQSNQILESLNQIGVNIALDDFGTGYSSMAYLKSFPFHTIKIDQSFIKDISIDAGDLAISHAIIAMAKAIGLKVVAEGVESEEALNILREIGCDCYQGFYYSEPLSPRDVQDLLNRIKLGNI